MTLEPVTLEGEWVKLVPLRPEHADELFASGSEPEVWRYTTVKIESVEAMRAYVQAALEEQARGVSMPFATCERASGRVVGTTRYMSIVLEHKRLEIGATFVGPSWQRTPINTEAKYLMLRHAFEVVGVNRVELKTNALNWKSRSAIQRVGGKEEGTLRRHMINSDGTIRDTVYFSVIVEEWPEVKTMLEEMLARPWQKSTGQRQSTSQESTA